MGSCLSGRKSDRPIAEDCFALDLAKLMRQGPIREGVLATGEYVWSIEGARIAAVRFRLDLRTPDAASLHLYSIGRPHDGRGERISQLISLCCTRPNFGGRRWWMCCPVSGNRARVLYLVPGKEKFIGRSALNLAYRSERISHFDRPFEKLFRLQRKLDSAQYLGSVPRRPKGMWRQTWAQHGAQLEALNLICAEQIADLIGMEH